MIGGGEGFHDTADDRSGTACLLIMVTAGGWKVLKEVKSKAVFFKLDEIREAIWKNNSLKTYTPEHILFEILHKKKDLKKSSASFYEHATVTQCVNPCNVSLLSVVGFLGCTEQEQQCFAWRL